MKRTLTKRAIKLSRLHLPQKPYEFCCEKELQDPERHYDMRNPPFASSLTDVTLEGGGPGVKFRVEDSGRLPLVALLQRRAQEAKAHLGSCERCRGPLLWYLEDELAHARDIFAKKRLDDHNRIAKRNLKIAIRKGSVFQTRERFDHSITRSLYVLYLLFY